MYPFRVTSLSLLLPAVALALNLVCSSTLWAHGLGGAFSAEVESVASDPSAPIEEPMPGARLFAWRLMNHGIYLMTAEQLRSARLAHSLLEASDETPADLPDSDARRARLTTAGQRELITLLESIEQVHRVEIDGSLSESESQFQFKLSGTAGALLFRLDNGDSDTTFITSPWTATSLDLSRIPEPQPVLPIEYSPGATTWYMLRVKHAPPGGMYTVVDAVPTDGSKETARFSIHLDSGSQGILKLRVVDEKGNQVPALINLTHTETGALYRPSGALELASQMIHIAGEPVPSPARPHPDDGEPFVQTIPGDEAGFYWLVPEESNMALPEGEWSVRVWKGPEFLLGSDEFTITAEKESTVTITMQRWEDMSKRGWWSGDAHIHARLMSDQDAERLLAWLEAADIHLGNIVRMGNYARTYFEQRGWGPEFRVQRGDRALVPGQEDPRFNHGHSLALNINQPVRDQSRYMFTDWAAEETAKAGGIYGNAHVQYNGFNVRRDLTLLMPRGLTHFGEVLQIGELGTDLYYDFLNMGFRMSAAAGSDVPFGHSLGEVRYYVYTGQPQLDVDSWFRAKKQGATFVSNGPMLELAVNDEIPGAIIDATEGTTLRIRARAWSAPTAERSLRHLQVHFLGDTIREVEGARGIHELELDFEIPAGFGGWVTAKAENRDGTAALTSPVYIQREGFRHWKYEAMPDLFAKVDTTLDEWAAETERDIRVWENHEVDWWNFYARGLAEMGPEHLQKIEETRRLYAELRTQWEAEKAPRAEAAREIAP